MAMLFLLCIISSGAMRVDDAKNGIQGYLELDQGKSNRSKSSNGFKDEESKVDERVVRIYDNDDCTGIYTEVSLADHDSPLCTSCWDRCSENRESPKSYWMKGDGMYLVAKNCIGQYDYEDPGFEGPLLPYTCNSFRGGCTVTLCETAFKDGRHSGEVARMCKDFEESKKGKFTFPTVTMVGFESTVLNGRYSQHLAQINGKSSFRNKKGSMIWHCATGSVGGWIVSSSGPSAEQASECNAPVPTGFAHSDLPVPTSKGWYEYTDKWKSWKSDPKRGVATHWGTVTMTGFVWNKLNGQYFHQEQEINGMLSFRNNQGAVIYYCDKSGAEEWVVASANPSMASIAKCHGNAWGGHMHHPLPSGKGWHEQRPGKTEPKNPERGVAGTGGFTLRPASDDSKCLESYNYIPPHPLAADFQRCDSNENQLWEFVDTGEFIQIRTLSLLPDYDNNGKRVHQGLYGFDDDLARVGLLNSPRSWGSGWAWGPHSSLKNKRSKRAREQDPQEFCAEYEPASRKTMKYHDAQVRTVHCREDVRQQWKVKP